jgi:hypothetical protein
MLYRVLVVQITAFLPSLKELGFLFLNWGVGTLIVASTGSGGVGVGSDGPLRYKEAGLLMPAE